MASTTPLVADVSPDEARSREDKLDIAQEATPLKESKAPPLLPSIPLGVEFQFVCKYHAFEFVSKPITLHQYWFQSGWRTALFGSAPHVWYRPGTKGMFGESALFEVDIDATHGLEFTPRGPALRVGSKYESSAQRYRLKDTPFIEFRTKDFLQPSFWCKTPRTVWD